MFSALEVKGDLVGKMARNIPWAVVAAFALALFSGACAVVALWKTPKSTWWPVRLSLVALVLAFGCAIWSSVGLWTVRQAPQIAANVDAKSPSLLHVTASAQDLQGHDYLRTMVVNLQPKRLGLLRTTKVYYSARVGPDTKGVATTSADVVVPVAAFAYVGVYSSVVTNLDNEPSWRPVATACLNAARATPQAVATSGRHPLSSCVVLFRGAVKKAG